MICCLSFDLFLEGDLFLVDVLGVFSFTSIGLSESDGLVGVFFGGSGKGFVTPSTETERF